MFQIALAYYLMTRAMRTITALDTAVLLLIEPLLNPTFVWLMHGEIPTPLAMTGGAMVLAATTWRSLTTPGGGHAPPPRRPRHMKEVHVITRHAGAAVALLVALTAAAQAQTPQPAGPTPAQPPAAPVPCNQAVPPCGPDSLPQPGVPKGEVIKGEFAASAIYPGTWREYLGLHPRGPRSHRPAPVMVFQDGLQYRRRSCSTT